MRFSKEYDSAAKRWNVSLSGEVDAAYSEEMKRELLSMIEEKPADIMLDCALLSYLDSSGLGVLIGTLKKAKEKGNKVVIKNLKPHIGRIFAITKLDTLFSIEVSK